MTFAVSFTNNMAAEINLAKLYSVTLSWARLG